MNLSLKPSSGYANSYFDIEFSIYFDTPLTGTITIFNKTTSQNLNILSVSTGTIIGENKINIVNCSTVTGFINLFNDDKMNTGLHPYKSINLEATFESKDTSIKSDTLFYNQSQSIDSKIVPFDLVLENNTLDLSQHVPLVITLVSTVKSKYEICIKHSPLSKQNCTFEVLAKKGVTTVKIPAEILYWDLELWNNKKRNFQFYYVKFEGITFSRVANRVYNLMPNINVTLNVSQSMMPESQKRLTPNNVSLPDDLVLSDRYLVLSPKKYSAFGSKAGYQPDKLLNMSMFLHESQHIKMLENKMTVHAMSNKESSIDQIKQTHKTMKNERLQSNVKTIKPKLNNNKISLFTSLDQLKKPANIQKPIQTESESKVSTFQSSVKTSCVPCSRKKQVNA